MSINYEIFVNLLRKIIPEFSLKNVKEDIEHSVEKIGIKIKYADMKEIDANSDISGYVHIVNGLPEIVVNGNDSEYRRRFTIAHELGHIFLHWGWLPGKKLDDDLVEVSYRNYKYDLEEKEKEIEADKFAIEFLAPQKIVKEFLRVMEEDFDIIDKEIQVDIISSSFKISKPASYILWNDIKG